MSDASPTPHHWAIVPAAGSGTRMGAAMPKQYLELCGRSVLEHTLTRLLEHPRIDGVVVALAPYDRNWARLRVPASKPLLRAVGGAERCHSVLNALERLNGLAHDDDWVLVHDAARPCVRHADIDRLLDDLAHSDGGLLGVPVTDTIKRADALGCVNATVPREGLWRALTPQMFRLSALRSALILALRDGCMVTDEAAAMERAGCAPRMVAGHGDNIKITRPEDLALAELYLRLQQAQTCA